MSKMSAIRTNHSFKTLAGEIAKGECVIFVGAGVSVPAGLPSWSDLETLMREEAGLSRSYSAPRMADCCKQVIGEEKFNSLIRERFRHAIKPTKAHRSLASLPVRIFVTTNYDVLLEEALRGKQRRHRVLSLGDTAEWMQIGDECSECQILKIHGCVLRTPNKLIITECDYLSFPDEHAKLMNGLAGILARRPILFVGYSLSDWHLLSLLHAVQKLTVGNSTNKYYLGIDLDPPTQELLETRYKLKVFNVTTETTKEKAVLSFFDMLVREFAIPQWLRKMLFELDGNKGPPEIDRKTELATLFSVFDVGTSMRLAMRIEQHERIHLPMNKVVRSKTIGDLLLLVRERKEQQTQAQ